MCKTAAPKIEATPNHEAATKEAHAPEKKAAPTALRDTRRGKKKAAPTALRDTRRGKKATPKKAAPTALRGTRRGKKKAAPVSRRDGSGHIDSKYAAELLEKSHSFSRKEDASAFLRGRSKDDPLAGELGKEFAETGTSGEADGNELRDADNAHAIGAPFVG